jgi:hypothetical protein
MFRRWVWLRILALSGTVFAAVPSTAAAQSTLPCSAPELTGDFGFALVCKGCSVSGKHIPGRPDIEFVTEPMLQKILKGGPADGKLEEYDVLVAVNAQLITTYAGATLYSWPTPGKPMRLTFRRDGALKDVDVVPSPRCRAITAVDSPPQIASRFGVASLLEPAQLSTRGRFGVYLSCGNCGLAVPGAALMPFDTLPEIRTVLPDTPAERAGLKVGDLLVAIDNLPLKSREGTLAFRNLKPGQKVVLSILRGAELLKVSLTAAPPR